MEFFQPNLLSFVLCYGFHVVRIFLINRYLREKHTLLQVHSYQSCIYRFMGLKFIQASFKPHQLFSSLYLDNVSLQYCSNHHHIVNYHYCVRDFFLFVGIFVLFT